MMLTVLDPSKAKLTYVAVHHVELHGTFPIKEMLTVEALTELATFTNRLEKLRATNVAKVKHGRK